MPKSRVSLVNIIVLVLLALTLSQSVVTAQSLGGIDLKTVKVDDLTDEEILSFMREAEERGLTQAQLEALARQQRVSESEIVKLRRRILKLRSRAAGAKDDSELNTADGQRRVKDSEQDEVFGSLSLEDKPVLSEEQMKIFGFDVFQRNSLTFTPNLNLPTPSDYQLGPDDEINVDLWGATQGFLQFTVSAEGTIRPENLSPIYVN